jgi:hypothetical protein
MDLRHGSAVPGQNRIGAHPQLTPSKRMPKTIYCNKILFYWNEAVSLEKFLTGWKVATSAWEKQPSPASQQRRQGG